MSFHKIAPLPKPKKHLPPPPAKKKHAKKPLPPHKAHRPCDH